MVALMLLCLIASRAQAAIGVGYETLVILPHAFTVNYWDQKSGWGVKGSADFGTSAFSLTTTLASIIGTIGLSGATNVQFYTLSVTKDYAQEQQSRSYFKLGALALSGKVAGVLTTGYLPIAGLGWEWQKLWGGSWAFASEIGFPELWTMGLKTYF